MHASWRVSASSSIVYYDEEEVIMVNVMSTAQASDTASPLTPTVTGDGVAEYAVINRSSKQINVVDRVSSGYTADDLARAAMADAGITVNGVTAGADGEYTYDVTLANGATETLTTVTEKLYKVTVEFAACGWTSYLSSYNKTLWMGETSAATLTVRLTGTINTSEKIEENTASGNFTITDIARTETAKEAQATISFASGKGHHVPKIITAYNIHDS